MITPVTVDIANTSAKNPTAIQNSRSVCHHPAIKSVATTDVAQPLTMLTAAVATAVRGLGSIVIALGSGGNCSAPAVASNGVERPGIWVVAASVAMGSGPVGARRMMRVRGSSDAFGGSGGFSLAGGWFGAVTGQPA